MTATTLTAYLCVKGAARALEFYKEAFGAKETMRITDDSGRVGHAEVEIDGVTISLADEHPEIGFLSPQSLGGSPVGLCLAVPDVDATVKRAAAAGATVSKPPEDQFYGHRRADLLDPFGHRWYISTEIEKVSTEEVLARAAQLQAKG